MDQFQERLNSLYDKIDHRKEPLGVGLKNQCFAGLAIEMAQQSGETLVAHFNKPLKTWKGLIKINNATFSSKRNETMLDHLGAMLRVDG